jgi:2-polyprenyl-3-methyl-5-hydroxy-6-metoxy-1,4-benzoquinol methylase
LIVCNLVLEHVADLGFVFAAAARCLKAGSEFFLCELHPFRQYEGTVANFSRGGETTSVAAFVHHLSEFFHVAESSGFAMTRFDERWHADDAGRPPRLVAFLFQLRSE